ncbi:MAG: DUF4013 domain-containing protein [Thermoanaerobaculia bacterium]
MSNVQVPPSGGTTGGTIDFGRPFTFVFQDPDWLKKILIGGLVSLLSIVLIGIFFIFGYSARLVRNVVAGSPRPLPEWDRWGEDFAEGAKLFFIMVIYYIPVIVIFGIGIGGAAAIGGLEQEAGGTGAAGGVMASGTMCLGWVVLLVLAILLPAALLRAIMHQSFGAAFQFGAVFSFIGSNAVNYLLSIVVYLVGSFIAQFGVILLCVGLLFTSFWAQVITAYAFADTYRLSPVK